MASQRDSLIPGIDRIWWIGGVTCSGKSTVAKLVAGRAGRKVYSTDDHFDRHARNATKERHPTMHSYQNDEWLDWVRGLLPDERAEVWLRFYRERFSMILDDLATIRGPSVVAEGVDLLPELVPLGIPARNVVWLVPSRPFFEDHYSERDWVSEGPDENTWRYYARMIKHVEDGVRQRDAAVMQVDGRTSPEEIAEVLTARFESSEDIDADRR